jgi:DNA-binding NtrC family response regulator
MSRQPTILIIEDDHDVAYSAHLLLRRAGRRIDLLHDPAALAPRLEQGTPDLVLLDLNFRAGHTSGAEGLRILDQLRALPRPPAVIAMTAYAGVPLAVEAMKRGAADFVTKPWSDERLLACADAALAKRAQPAAESTATAALMGESAPMRELRGLIHSIGPTDANVLVLGENGVGKELVARALHHSSARASGPCLAVDMGSLPETMFESEMFGHRRGAFTDARGDRAGRFLAAAGGTLFLDEIGNLPLAAQAKLLAVLERREVTPLGADKAEPVDVRIVSATNLEEATLYEPTRFRPDLLFRLNTIVLRVPPLRERAQDIPLLLEHNLAHYQRQYGKPPGVLLHSAFDALCNHPWPGNVRALRHACERAVILADGETYRLADFGLAAAAARPGGEVAGKEAAPAATGLALGTLERDAIATALQRAKGNIALAARLLGVSRGALYRKLEKHGL